MTLAPRFWPDLVRIPEESASRILVRTFFGQERLASTKIVALFLNEEIEERNRTPNCFRSPEAVLVSFITYPTQSNLIHKPHSSSHMIWRHFLDSETGLRLVASQSNHQRNDS